MQAQSHGALRGIKDTRVPSRSAIASYWTPGFSLSLALAFGAGLNGLGLGVVGLWIGLSAGLNANGALLLARLHRRVRSTTANRGAVVLSRPG